MKKTISVILALFMVFLLTTVALATDTPNAITVSAKVAFASNISENGANLADNIHIGDNIELEIATLSSGDMQISATINGTPITISGTAKAKSENNHAVFFSATTNNPQYKVVDLEYVDDAGTSMVFKDYQQASNSPQILKLYLRNLSSQTRDYVLIECFEYTLPNLNALKNSLPIDNLMGTWISKEFLPISSTSYEESSYRDAPDDLYQTFSFTYSDGLETLVHKLTLEFHYSFPKLSAGGQAQIFHMVTIDGKSITCEQNPSLESNTTCGYTIDNIVLKESTVQNVAFVTTQIDGEVMASGGSTPMLSANLGIGLGPLSLSLSAPMESPSTVVDINPNFTYHKNGVNGNYVRSIKVDLDNKYYLRDINQHFLVNCLIQDFGNKPQSSQTHCAEWILTLRTFNQGTTVKTITHNYQLAIQ